MFFALKLEKENMNLSKLSRLRTEVAGLLNMRFTTKYRLSQLLSWHAVWKVSEAQLYKQQQHCDEYKTVKTLRSFASADVLPRWRSWRRPRLPARPACCWPAPGSGSPEAGGEGEAGRRDPGPRSPPGRPSNRGRGAGRRGQPAAAPAWGKGRRETLQGGKRGRNQNNQYDTWYPPWEFFLLTNG